MTPIRKRLLAALGKSGVQDFKTRAEMKKAKELWDMMIANENKELAEMAKPTDTITPKKHA